MRCLLPSLSLVVHMFRLFIYVTTSAIGVTDLGPVPQIQEQSAAGDSTGGVKEEKGLWLACQSASKSGWTCPRPHGNAVVFFFCLAWCRLSLPIVETQKIPKDRERRHRRETGVFLREKNDVTVWDPGLFDPARCAHFPGNDLKI